MEAGEYGMNGTDSRNIENRRSPKGEDQQFHPTLAGLIFFSDFITFMDELPNYFLDYRERMATDTRWSDCICVSDGDWSSKIQLDLLQMKHEKK